MTPPYGPPFIPEDQPNQWPEPVTPEEIYAQVNSVYPPMAVPIAPSPRMARIFGMNVNLSGALSGAARGASGYLATNPRGGGGFARGLVTGLADERVRQDAKQANALALQQKAYQDNEAKRREYGGQVARDLANHRWQAYHDQQREPSASMVDVTDRPDLQSIASGRGAGMPSPDRNGRIMVPASWIGPKSEPDPAMAELRALSVRQKQQEIERAGDALDQNVRGIAEFRTDPTRVPRNKDYPVLEAKVNEALKASGSPWTMNSLQMAHKQATQFYSVMNRERATMFRTSANTVRQHIHQFRELYDKYAPRMKNNIRMVNRGFFQGAVAGALGEDAQADALALQPVLDALPIEIATVVAGGRAPYEPEIRHAMTAYVDPFVRAKAADAKLRSTEGLLEARVKSQMAALPFGYKDNPYLAEVTSIPGWEDVGPYVPPGGRGTNPNTPNLDRPNANGLDALREWTEKQRAARRGVKK